MSTERHVSHPAFPAVVRTIKASSAKSWEEQGWVTAESPKPAAKKASHPKKADTDKAKSASQDGTAELKVNHQHD